MGSLYVFWVLIQKKVVYFYHEGLENMLRAVTDAKNWNLSALGFNFYSILTSANMTPCSIGSLPFISFMLFM
ncbi:MAG: hypothetical protein Q7U38_09155, partial [Methylobacter sp.]|nr:hypothetical protein [Methylobacter sp.]